MRILMANALFPPARTGSAIFTEQLALSLTEIGHEVQVVTTTNADGDGLNECPIHVTRLKSRNVSVGRLAWNYVIPLSVGPKNARAIKQIMRSFRPEVVICHGQIFDLTWLTAIVARLCRIPVVVVVHTAIWNENRFRRFVLRAFERIVINPILKYAKADFIAVDKWTHGDAKRLLAKHKPVQVIPVSVDSSQFQDGDPEIARERYGIPNSPILLSLGHVIALRNRHALVRALQLIIDEVPDVTVVIAGELYDSSFLDIANDLGVAEHIICLGSVPHQDIKHLLATAAIELHDLQGLGLGITTMEAMASGVPIVAWASDDNYPGISLRSYEGLMFIDDVSPEVLSAAVLKMLHDPAAREKAVAAQRLMVNDLFHPLSVAQSYQTVMQSVLPSDQEIEKQDQDSRTPPLIL